jgi:hypothetical protein
LTTSEKTSRKKVAKGDNRMPADSTFYDKVVPAILIFLAAITIILILVAIGVLVGIIPF